MTGLPLINVTNPLVPIAAGALHVLRGDGYISNRQYFIVS